MHTEGGHRWKSEALQLYGNQSVRSMCGAAGQNTAHSADCSQHAYCSTPHEIRWPPPETAVGLGIQKSANLSPKLILTKRRMCCFGEQIKSYCFRNHSNSVRTSHLHSNLIGQAELLHFIFGLSFHFLINLLLNWASYDSVLW